MSIREIELGNKSKQGNAKCPQCGKRVLITNQWGDPPKCQDCGIYYVPDRTAPMYR